MITLKNNDDLITLPQSYAEITVHQFLKLRDESRTPVDVLSILTNKDRSYWAEQVDRLQFDTIVSLVEWVHNVPDTSKYLRPDKIEIDGKRYSLPDGLGLHTVDQQFCFEDVLQKGDGNSDIDMVAPALAIYFQPLIDGGKFDSDRLPHIEGIIKNCIISEAFPVFAFFLQKYFEFLKERAKRLPINQLKQNKGLVLIASRNLVSSARLNLFRRACAFLLRKFSNLIIVLTSYGSGTTKKNRHFKKE